MPIQILISGEHLPVVLAEVTAFADAMRAPVLQVTETVSLGTAANLPAAASPAIPVPAQPATAKPAGRGRGRTAAAPPPNANVSEASKDPERPAHLNRAENDFIVYEKDGKSGPGYAKAADAVGVIISRLAKIDVVDELDTFASTNEATLQRMTDAERKPADEAIQARYVELGADPAIDNGDGNNEPDPTPAVPPVDPTDQAAVKAALQEYGKTAGLPKVLEVMAKYGASKFPELKMSDYAAALADIGRAVTAPAKSEDVFG